MDEFKRFNLLNTNLIKSPCLIEIVLQVEVKLLYLSAGSSVSECTADFY